jgi:hypothetical protein
MEGEKFRPANHDYVGALGVASTVGLFLVTGDGSVGRPSNCSYTCIDGMREPNGYCVYTIQM